MFLKKSISQLFFICLFILVSMQAAIAQDEVLTTDFKQKTIERLSAMLAERYVFPDVAKTMGEHFNQQLKAGRFNESKDVKAFAQALTDEAQAISKDKHLRIRPAPPRAAQVATIEQKVDGRIQDMEWQREQVAGFSHAEKFEGNIGYLDLRGFAAPDFGAPVADHYMALLSTSDAIIIDLRKNGGGSPGMVRYLCSYFFEKPTHLNSLYWREGDRTEE
ncbi:MAG: hypothetical protein AAB316_11095, partial [Bacteroidota bacterium]